MTSTLERPRTATAAPDPRQRRAPERRPTAPRVRRGPNPSAKIELSVLALMITAALPLSRVFASAEWVRPTLGAIIVTLGVAAGARRARLPLLASLAVQVLAFGLYLGVVFVPDTLVLGVLPTFRTPPALWSLFTQALTLLPQRVAPAAVIPPLAFLAVGGTGAIAIIADLLVHAGRAPFKAVVVALTLWAVPLSMAPGRQTAATVTVPVLAAIALLLLATSGADVARWGRWIYPRGRSDAVSRGTFAPGGIMVSISAIVAGLFFAGSLPGYDEAPWWQLRGAGGSTLTANPIVQLRSNLVATGTEPIFTVQTPRPVYLRTTALDVFGEFEEWTTSGIRTQPLRGGQMATGTADNAFGVDIRVGDIEHADLVPMPFQPIRATGGISDAFQFDPRTGTVVLDEGVQMEAGDRYSVIAAVPRPSAEILDEAGVRAPGDDLTQLPENVPAEVAELAQRIVADAGATTPFRQALAIQNELRTWEYSLDPPAGHDGTAMMQFLQSRVGYCEQFAGTMAVMLRTLDIPARVAVGFTPGKLLDPAGDTYAVSWANSHAWVEVLFPDVGWIAFEPTPRGDGNVLVPTSGDPSPQVLEQDPAVIGGPQGPYDDAGQLLIPGGADVLSPEDRREALQPRASGGGTSRTGSSVTAVIVIAVLVALAALANVWRHAIAAPSRDAPPAERILAAGRAVRRTGAGLQVPARATETDREYLRRLARASGGGASRAGSQATHAWGQLGDTLARARYARSVTAEDAVTAERAADEIVEQLVGSLSRSKRMRVAARGAAVEVRGQLADTVVLRRWNARRAVATER